MNANTQMRDPAWNKGRRACTLTMHPEDAEKMGFSDGDTVRVVTEAGDTAIKFELVSGSATKFKFVSPTKFVGAMDIDGNLDIDSAVVDFGAGTAVTFNASVNFASDIVVSPMNPGTRRAP